MKLSVCLLTYNHERFIARALDGVLMQEAGFPFEVVVGEDCSTDRTAAVVAEYARRRPGLFRVLPTPANLGGKRNFLRTLAACEGQYVALLEGDDYWTDPAKLRRQAEALDRDPGVAVCGHPVEQVDDQGRPLGRFPATVREVMSLDDLFEYNFIPTCSAVFRNGLSGEFPLWFLNATAGDWPLHMLNARRGTIRMLPEVMGAYRLHGGGVWSSRKLTERIEETLKMLEAVREHFGPDYDVPLRRAIAKQRLDLAWAAAGLGDRLRSWRELRPLLFRPVDRRRHVSAVKKAAVLLRLLSPGLYRLLDRMRPKQV